MGPEAHPAGRRSPQPIRRPVRTWGAFVLAACAGALIACGEGTTPPGADPPRDEATTRSVSGDRRPNLLLVTLDTTRADALGVYGQTRPTSPHIDRLAARGVVFDQVTTTNPETLPSHASLFTGKWPYAHGVRANSGFVLAGPHPTLAETLRAHDYRTGAEVAARVLRRETRITRGFAHYRGADSPGVEHKTVTFVDPDREPTTLNVRVARDITARGIEFLEAQGEQPFFLWLHYFDAHHPYSAPPRFNSKIPDSPYHAEVAYQDAELGLVLDSLDRLGLRHDTLVVVTADHGEDLLDHGEPTHSYVVYETTMRVPLIMAGLPAVPEGVRVGTPVRTIDVAPTVLDLLGLPRPDAMQGVSLRPALSRPDAELGLTGYGESTRFMAAFGLPVVRLVREGRWKYIHKTGPELYDVLADPAERDDRIDDRPDVADALRERLATLLDEAPAAPAGAVTRVDEETAAELAVLGYLGHSAPAELDDGAERLDLWGRDPNEALPHARTASAASGLVLQHEYAEALALLEPIARRYPESRFLLDLLATVHHELGDDAAAIDAMQRSLALEPCDQKTRRAALGLVRAAGRAADHLAVLATVAEGCPGDVDNLNDYAWVLATAPQPELRDGDEALRTIRAALAEQQTPDPALLDTLAAVHAERGDFAEAVRIEADVVARLRAEGAPAQVIEATERHLATYRSGEPIREPL